jgi:hypothetical protein
MRLSLTRSESIDLTIIITHLTSSHLCLLLLVRLGGYIVNLLDFHSYRLIENLADLVFSSHLKSRVDNILSKVSVLRITLNLDGTPVVSQTHTHPSHSQTSRLLTSSLSLGVPVPRATQCIRVV